MSYFDDIDISEMKQSEEFKDYFIYGKRWSIIRLSQSSKFFGHQSNNIRHAPSFDWGVQDQKENVIYIYYDRMMNLSEAKKIAKLMNYNPSPYHLRKLYCTVPNVLAS